MACSNVHPLQARTRVHPHGQGTGIACTRRFALQLWRNALRGWQDRSADAAVRSLPGMGESSAAEVQALMPYCGIATHQRYTQLHRRGAPLATCCLLLQGTLKLAGAQVMHGWRADGAPIAC